jgi:hypothetical protein
LFWAAKFERVRFVPEKIPNNNLLNFNTKKLHYNKMHPTPTSQSHQILRIGTLRAQLAARTYRSTVLKPSHHALLSHLNLLKKQYRVTTPGPLAPSKKKQITPTDWYKVLNLNKVVWNTGYIFYGFRLLVLGVFI